MATIRLSEVETYPDYLLDDEHPVIELDVPDDVAARWRAARAHWDEALNEINAAYRAIEFANQPPYTDQTPPYPGRRLQP